MKKLLIVLFAFLHVVQGQVRSCECGVDPNFRRRCSLAPRDADSNTCAAAGCCYDQVPRRFFIFGTAPRCYLSTGSCPTFTCAIPNAEKRWCGNRNRINCLFVGCCYDSGSRPLCYYSRSVTDPRLTASAATTAISPAPPSWSSWTNWSFCSSSCSAGFQSRSRSCAQGGRVVSTNFCSGQSSQRESCNVDLCQQWAQWSTDGTCQGACGSRGTISRNRSCVGRGRLGESRCYSLTRSCFTEACVQQTPTWGAWGQWSDCSSECTSGTRFRFRSCTQLGLPAATRLCLGSYLTQYFSLFRPRQTTREDGPCNEYLCRALGSWTSYSVCPKTCVTNDNERIMRLSTRACLVASNRQAVTLDQAKQAITCRTRTQACQGLIKCSEAPFTVTSKTLLNVTSQPMPKASSTASPKTSPIAREGSTSSVTMTTALTSDTATTTRTDALFTSSNYSAEVTYVTSVMTLAETTTPIMIWTGWSGCTSPCGPGIQIRLKICEKRIGGLNGNSKECGKRRQTDSRPCNTQLCRNWGVWSSATCTEDCDVTKNNSKTVQKQRTRICRAKTQEKGEAKCFRQELRCIPSTNCSIATNISTTVEVPSASTSNQTWDQWESWSDCSESCGSGVRMRSRNCDVNKTCTGSRTEQQTCNVDYCDNWSDWTTNACSAACGKGERFAERRCHSNMSLGAEECHRRREECQDFQCDENLDILFLVDSSTFVDDCSKIRNGTKGSITSQNINDDSTPNYSRMKKFMTEFVSEWRTIDNNKTRVAIQLISDICNSKNEENLHLIRNFNESYSNVTEQINEFPYLCGKFWLDWAIRCSLNKVITTTRGDREFAPNVMVTLLGYVPSWARPGSFALSSLSNELRRKDITVVTASATDPESLSSLARKKFDDMLRALPCGSRRDCPSHIGSIWDEDLGSPAARVRSALKKAKVM